MFFRKLVNFKGTLKFLPIVLKLNFFLCQELFFVLNREDLEKQLGCGEMVHERLTEPRVTIE